MLKTYSRYIQKSIYSLFDKKQKRKASTSISSGKLIPFYEQFKYNYTLYQTSIFPYQHTHRVSTVERRVLSFRFRPIEFNKKRSLLFFLALELITSKKAVAVLSTKKLQAWKIRKGRLVACKVTLRKEALFQLIDTFTLSFLRREKLAPFSIKILKKPATRTLYQAPTEFRFGELVLIYPLEISMGLHPDLQFMHRSTVFNTLSNEERVFLLRALQFPF